MCVWEEEVERAVHRGATGGSEGSTVNTLDDEANVTTAEYRFFTTVFHNRSQSFKSQIE